ncbi:MAG: nucleoside phosphorylase [Brevinema sp.]
MPIQATFSNNIEEQELAFHLKTKKGDVNPYVLLPGDPKRCGVIAKFLENPVLVGDHREYTIINGTYKGVPVTICSTGIGGPSASIAVEELILSGAHTFIRVGTSGALKLSVNTGDLVIAQAAVRDEGTANQYLPKEFPLRASLEVIKALRDASKAYPHHIGVVHSKDAFYTELEPENAFFRDQEEQKLQHYSKAGVLCSEMEVAAVLAVSNIRRVRAGAILQVVEAPMMKRMNIRQELEKPIDDMIVIALEALRMLHTQDQKEAHHE